MNITNPKVIKKIKAVVDSFLSGRYIPNPTTTKMNPMKMDAIAKLH